MMTVQKPMTDLVAGAQDVLDKVALEVECKWGPGDSICRYVGEEWADKFRQQQKLLDDALSSGDTTRVIKQAQAMTRAWQKLDEVATASNAKPVEPDVWEFKTPAGHVIALTKTKAEAFTVANRHNRKAFSLEEIGHLIDSQLGSMITKAKDLFPGAVVESVTETLSDDFWDKGGDDLPEMLR